MRFSDSTGELNIDQHTKKIITDGEPKKLHQFQWQHTEKVRIFERLFTLNS